MVVVVAPPHDPAGAELLASCNVWIDEQTPLEEDVKRRLVAEQLSLPGAAAKENKGTLKSRKAIARMRTERWSLIDRILA